MEVINGLGFPESVAQAPAAEARPILACPEPLPFAKKARLQKPDMTMALMGALLARATADERAELCREGPSNANASVYRKQGNKQGYTIAIADAGRSIEVDRTIMVLVEGAGYSVRMNDLAVSYSYPQFDKLPAPAQVLEMVQSVAPVSSAPIDGQNITIEGEPE
ncbi:MAG TPA: hypothetical protein VFF84_08290 [Sphingobium sp.]|nr:hypothetical protein [Sphingobium sp.]